jgi:uncharacterized protein with NRDE domain
VCLLVLAWKVHPRYRLIVAANRDEYHERSAAPLGLWPESPNILAGRDLRAGGTWLGLSQARRFGIITNFRDLQRPQPDAPSRGALIPHYLSQAEGPAGFLKTLAGEAPRYSGFNLLLTDHESLWYASNRAEHFACPLPAGVHGLSNQFLDTPWPKLVRVRRGFESWLSASMAASATPSSLANALFQLLEDREPAPEDSSVPAKDLDPQLARALSAPFVLNPVFGTRSATVLFLDPSGALSITERRYDASGATNGETQYELPAGGWPQPPEEPTKSILPNATPL